MDYQDKYDKAIENVKNGGSVYINEVLGGELNLRGNKDIAELHFAGGSIERIYNVPRTLKKLVINNNKLVELPLLELSNLVHLEAANNLLSRIDLKPFTNLAHINVCNNGCNAIENIPESLKYFFADNNKLTSLNLNNVYLNRLSCVGNKMLKKITGTQHAGSITKDNETQITGKATIVGGTRTDVQEAVNEYYTLKSLYENDLHQSLKSAYIKYSSKKDRTKEMQKIRANSKCVNCKKNGGTKFWKDAKGHLRAICGNSMQPCFLNIDILASLNEVQVNINKTQQRISETKQEIVKLKMDTIFGYVSDAESVKEFERLKKTLMDDTDAAVLNDDKYSLYEIVNNSDNQRILSSKMEDIHKELGEIRGLMNKYNKTGRDKFIKDIALKHKMVNDQIEIVRGLKYPVCEVVQVKGLNVLKQYPYSFDELHNKHADLLKVEIMNK